MKKYTTFSFNNRWLYTYCFYLISIIASAQNLEFIRQSNRGTTGSARATASAVDASGNVYITGHFDGTETFGSFTLVSTGSSNSYPNAFIAKYDASGTCLWAKRAGGVSSCRGEGISVLGSSVYIIGSFFGTVNFNTPAATGTNEITSAGGDDIFVAKYDDEGTFQWAKRAGATSTDYGLAIAASGSSVYITGYFAGTTNFNTPSATGSNEIISAGASDIFIAKYNEAGTFQWAKRAGGVGSDLGEGITISGTSIYLTGYFSQTTNFNMPSAFGSNEIVSAGEYDMFVAKYDDSGTFQWAKRAGGTGGDGGFGIAVSGASVYVTGYISFTANFNTPSDMGSNTLVSVGNGDIFLAKYDDNGTLQWIKRGGANGVDNGNGIVVTDKFIFISGSFNGTANFNTPSAGGINEATSAGQDDIFLLKYDLNGNYKSSKRAGGANGDRAIAISAFGSSVYTTGYINGTVNFNTPSASGSNELSTGGGFQVFLAKYDTTTVAPAFRTQPVSMTTCENLTKIFNLSATDANFLQWQIFNGTEFVDLTNTAPYSYVNASFLYVSSPSLSLNGSIYRCVATGSGGVAYSNPVTLTVNANVITETANITGGTVIKKAGQTLTATNIISESANVNYSAGKYVLMNPGFQVQNGSIYSASVRFSCN